MKHGIVTSTSTTDEGLQLATVLVQRVGVTYDKCPVAHSFQGHSQSISEGDHVLLDKTNDGLWVVMGVLTINSETLPDDVNGQERVIAFDDGTEISVRENGGSYDVKISASKDVNIQSTNKINVSSDGDMTITSGGHLQFDAQSVDFDTG